MKLRSIATAAALTALIASLTLAVSIPVANVGYLNFGDVFVLLGAAYLSPLLAFLAAGIGSALADVLMSYTHYALFTFLIKGLEGGLVAYLFSRNSKRHFTNFLCGALLMAGGYALTDLFLYNNMQVFWLSLAINMLQGVLALTVVSGLYPLVKKHLTRRENGHVEN